MCCLFLLCSDLIVVLVFDVDFNGDVREGVCDTREYVALIDFVVVEKDLSRLVDCTAGDLTETRRATASTARVWDVYLVKDSIR